MDFKERLAWLQKRHEELITLKNAPVYVNGVYERFENPVLTGDHAHLFWRYDLNPQTILSWRSASAYTPHSTQAPSNGTTNM